MKNAVIVPGIGYTTDRSLLYFAGKLAEQTGYQRKIIRFSGFEKGVKGDSAKMKRAFLHAYDQLTEQLSGFEAGEDIFISKSIGTAVSLKADIEMGLQARHILFTPLMETMELLKELIRKQGDDRKGDIIVFHGLSDPWAADNDAIAEAAKDCGVSFHEVEAANHSIETGDAIRDVKNLLSVLETCRQFMN